MTDGNGNGMGQAERELLARITLQIDRASAHQHQLARRGRVLRESATHLRLAPEAQLGRWELLARITLQIDRASTYQHALARRRAVLQESATQLRLGSKAQVVLARIQEQIPDAVRVMESLAQ